MTVYPGNNPVLKEMAEHISKGRTFERGRYALKFGEAEALVSCALEGYQSTAISLAYHLGQVRGYQGAMNERRKHL